MKLSDLLVKQAAKLISVSPEHKAIGLLKSAGLSDDQAREKVAQALMEKEAVSHLVESGIDYDRALSLVKVADVRLKDLSGFKPTKSPEEILSETLTKMAQVAQALEDEIETLMEKVAELESGAPQETADLVGRLSQSGTFTYDDLDALLKLPSTTLTKVASSAETPWKMGKSAGLAVNSMDPLSQFILS